MADNEKQDCENCPAYILMSKPDDTPTYVSGLGFRVWFSLVSVCALGLVVVPPTRDSVISILIFIIPMMREYYGFKPLERKRVLLRRCQLAVIWTVVTICGLQVIGVLELSGEKIVISQRFAILAGFSFKFVFVWGLLWVVFVLTIADYFVYRPKSYQSQKVSKRLK